MPHADPVPADAVWCVIPVFNNRETVRKVAEDCRALLGKVLVVDDGSTDADLTELLAGLDVTLVSHGENQGKGEAILTASRYIEDHGGDYMITIDADGQHLPRDLEKFLPLLRTDDPAIVIGCRNFDTVNVPGSSRFGRSFANFWLLVETGVVVRDCQSGFRAYPVRHLNRLRFKGAHYDFEAEVLARGAWGGLALRMVDIDVIYPKPEERVSSFRPFLDNLRFTGIHSMLVGRRMVPFRHQQLVERKREPELSLVRHPGKVLRKLLMESATPQGLALSAAVGLFIAVLPIPFLHSVIILFFAMRFNLNKIVALNIQHLAMPPVVPALCIELGYYFRHGRWLTDLSFETVFRQFSSRFFEWFLGSLFIAPLAALFIGAVVYLSAATIRKIRCSHASKDGC
jgi:glycosyltransferase involved in cell wall biosynthesis